MPPQEMPADKRVNSHLPHSNRSDRGRRSHPNHPILMPELATLRKSVKRDFEMGQEGGWVSGSD
jgi:hypothetical protein